MRLGITFARRTVTASAIDHT